MISLISASYCIWDDLGAWKIFPRGVPMICVQFWELSKMLQHREMQTSFSNSWILGQTVYVLLVPAKAPPSWWYTPSDMMRLGFWRSLWWLLGHLEFVNCILERSIDCHSLVGWSKAMNYWYTQLLDTDTMSTDNLETTCWSFEIHRLLVPSITY